MIINSLKELNIIVFLEILEENNYLLLDTEYSKDKIYSEEQKKEIEDIWLGLYDEYFLLENDHFVISYLSNKKKIFELETLILVLTKNHDLLVSLQNFEFSKDIAETKFKIIKSCNEIEPRLKLIWHNDLVEVCGRIEKFLKALGNNLNDLKSSEKKKEDKKKKKFNVYDVITGIEQTLERSLGDTKQINVLQFLSYKEMAKKIIASKQTKKK